MKAPHHSSQCHQAPFSWPALAVGSDVALSHFPKSWRCQLPSQHMHQSLVPCCAVVLQESPVANRIKEAFFSERGLAGNVHRLPFDKLFAIDSVKKVGTAQPSVLSLYYVTAAFAPCSTCFTGSPISRPTPQAGAVQYSWVRASSTDGS